MTEKPTVMYINIDFQNDFMPDLDKIPVEYIWPVHCMTKSQRFSPPEGSIVEDATFEDQKDCT